MPSNHYPRIGTRNHWLKIGLMTVLLLGSGASGLNAREALSEPLEEIEAFATAGVAGILVLPAGVPDRPTPAILILQDAQGPDGRANHYVDHLLGAGFAVLEVLTLESDSLEGVLSALSAHPRVAGRPLGLLGFGAGARLAAEWSRPVSARALLYPGCGGLVPAAMRG